MFEDVPSPSVQDFSFQTPVQVRRSGFCVGQVVVDRQHVGRTELHSQVDQEFLVSFGLKGRFTPRQA